MTTETALRESNTDGLNRPLNILLLGVQVPFTRGGAEILISRLRTELSARGHCVDLVQLPFSANPKSGLLREMALWRAVSLHEFAGRTVDLVIPTKFPSYLVTHPCKSLWLVHQHRQVYELYNTRFGDFDTSPEDEAIRRAVFEADACALAECAGRFTIAPNVSARLKTFLGIDSIPLLPPIPLAGKYRSGETGRYILSVGRLCSIKRVDLMVRALAAVSRELKLVIVGAPDEPAMEEYLHSEVRKHHLADRVEFRGRVSDVELIDLYADAFAVYYAPHNEDYGFVTLEARAAGKPVITASDSGTVLDFIRHEKNGLVAEPEEASIAAACNRLLHDRELYGRMAHVEDVQRLTATWDDICDSLTAPARRVTAGTDHPASRNPLNPPSPGVSAQPLNAG